MSEVKAHRCFLHAITPLHAGVGQAASIVDLPIAREKATGWPVVPGSSLKGVLRCALPEKADLFFGSRPRTGAEEGKAGALSLTDQRILCLPVRSFFGTFAWVTSPLALGRYARDARALGMDVGFEVPPTESDALLSAGTLLAGNDGMAYLEDIDLSIRTDEAVERIAAVLGGAALGEAASGFAKRFAIVPDNVFDFLCETAMEVTARIALGEDGTTSGKGGNLWYEEAVPAESLFYGFVVDGGRENAVLEQYAEAVGAEKLVQIGGNGSVGHGLCRLVMQR